MDNMDFNAIFKSIIDDLDGEVCFCDLNHVIRYMNKNSIERHAKRGGAALVGQSLFGCHNKESEILIQKYVDQLIADPDLHEINMGHNHKHGETNFIIAVRDENKNLIGYYERHDKD